jgi:hypothetical protein
MAICNIYGNFDSHDMDIICNAMVMGVDSCEFGLSHTVAWWCQVVGMYIIRGLWPPVALWCQLVGMHIIRGLWPPVALVVPSSWYAYH